MELALSWDLFVLSIFIAVVAYSLIIGLNQTLKTLITTYLSLLAADGLGNLIQEYILQSANMSGFLNLFDLGENEATLVGIKVTIFLVAIVLLTIKGSFKVNMESQRFPSLNPIMTLLFGTLNSALILSTLLIFSAGSSLIRANFVENNLSEMYASSSYIKLLIDHHSLWFSLPVLIYIVWCLIDHELDEAI